MSDRIRAEAAMAARPGQHDRLMAIAAEVAKLETPSDCAACGSPDIHYDPVDGWSCRSCHRSDADE